MSRFKKGDRVRVSRDAPEEVRESRGKTGNVWDDDHLKVGPRSLLQGFPIDETVTYYTVLLDDGQPVKVLERFLEPE